MMGERLAESPERDTGIRYDDETKERAYELWAFVVNGNAEKVAARLSALDPPIVVDGRTVRDWSVRYRWAIRRADDWRRIAPDLTRQVAMVARYGLLESAVMARDMVTNERTRTITTVTPNGSVRTAEVPEITAKDRIAAGTLLEKIDTSLRAIGITDQPTSLPSRDLRSLTDSELLELERNT